MYAYQIDNHKIKHEKPMPFGMKWHKVNWRQGGDARMKVIAAWILIFMVLFSGLVFSILP